MERSLGIHYRRQRFALRTKRFAVTVHKRNLLKFDTLVEIKLVTASYTITPKVLAAAQRDIEIARELSIKFSHMVTSRLPHPKRSNSWLSWRYIS